MSFLAAFLCAVTLLFLGVVIAELVVERFGVETGRWLGGGEERAPSPQDGGEGRR